MIYTISSFCFHLCAAPPPPPNIYHVNNNNNNMHTYRSTPILYLYHKNILDHPLKRKSTNLGTFRVDRHVWSLWAVCAGRSIPVSYRCHGGQFVLDSLYLCHTDVMVSSLCWTVYTCVTQMSWWAVCAGQSIPVSYWCHGGQFVLNGLYLCHTDVMVGSLCWTVYTCAWFLAYWEISFHEGIRKNRNMSSQ